MRRIALPMIVATQVYHFGPSAVIRISGRSTGICAVVGVGEDVALVDEACTRGVADNARAVPVSSAALGVNVSVAVGAPKFVGVGEKVSARDVEVRKDAPAVFVCWATIVLIPWGVGVAE